MRKTLTLALLLPALALSFGGKKPKKGKKKGSAAPLVGWQIPANGSGECHYPPAFAELAQGPRMMARQQALEAALSQWRGERGDGVGMSDIVAHNVETVLLGRPAEIEPTLAQNLQWCEKVRRGEAEPSAWQAWLSALPAKLTEGECKGSILPNTLYDYLNIHTGWHVPAPVCQGDEVVISVSASDFYRIERGGPWINAAGDTKQPGGSDDLCSTEGCYKGTVLLRFQGESGVDQIVPVGTGMVFKAPEHGRIALTINDSDYTDNEWKVESGLQHHSSVSYAPR